MMRRALRIAGGIAVAVAATALTHAALPAHASNPGTCGIDDAPVCPVVTPTAPSTIDGTLTASSLASVARVELLPGGEAVGIAERSDTQLVVIVPRGAISPGNTYHL